MHVTRTGMFLPLSLSHILMGQVRTGSLNGPMFRSLILGYKMKLVIADRFRPKRVWIQLI